MPSALTAADVVKAMDGTWMPRAMREIAGWTIRDGAGGGKRVSAATITTVGARIEDAVAEMRGLGQTPLFMIRQGDLGLDQELAALGYGIVDPVVIYGRPVTSSDQTRAERNQVTRCQAPLRIIEEIWQAGGIGPQRLAVMDRTPGPKTYLLARSADRPAGVAFAAVSGDIAMVHAIEVLQDCRRSGVGSRLLAEAFDWARDTGANRLALAVTEANSGAIRLYQRLGMAPLGHYHYRIACE